MFSGESLGSPVGYHLDTLSGLNFFIRPHDWQEGPECDSATFIHIQMMWAFHSSGGTLTLPGAWSCLLQDKGRFELLDAEYSLQRFWNKSIKVG